MKQQKKKNKEREREREKEKEKANKWKIKELTKDPKLMGIWVIMCVCFWIVWYKQITYTHN